MMLNTIRLIKESYSAGLPGEQGHALLAPNGRLKIKPPAEKAPRLAAVLILIYPSKETPHIVFMKRQEYPGVHSGQISFPGGEFEESDLNLKKTALREAREELNIQAEKLELVGALSNLYIPPSNFEVTPYLGYSLQKPDFEPDGVEVAEILEIPLNFFLEEPIEERKIQMRDSAYLRVPAFNYEGNIIWGATAMILGELIAMLNKRSE